MSVIDFDVYDRGQVRTGRDGVSQIRVKVRARCSSLDDSLTSLRIGMPMYQRWQPHPTEQGFYVDDFQGDQQTNGFYWDCVVTYTDGAIKDPLQEPATIGEVKTFKLDAATIVDWQNKPILNTAGEPPEPFNKPEQIVVYPIIKNIPGLQDWLLEFESCINADAVRVGSFVCPPKTVLINSIVISEENTQGDKPYRRCVVELWRRKSQWLEIFPSRGFNQLVQRTRITQNRHGTMVGSIVKELQPITQNGQPLDKPAFLDKDGKWIKDPTPDQIVMLTAQLYPAIPFNQFPLK